MKKTKKVKKDNNLKKEKEDFLKFLEKNKKDLSTGFGAFHHNAHGNW